MPLLAVLLIRFVSGTLITGVLLWIAIKLFDSSNAMNSVPNTFGIAAVLTLVSFIPMFGAFVALLLLVMFLLKTYDLGIGQTFMVFFFLLAANIGLAMLLMRLAGE